MWILTAVLLCLSINYSYADNSTERNVTNKIAVITGAAEGLGYAIADNLLNNNAKLIIIVDKNETQGELATSTLNGIYGDGKVVFYHGDVVTDLDKIATDILDKYEVNILVNNAGVVDEYDVEHTINVNVVALMQWAYRFFKAMRKDQGGNGGTIVNLSSVAGNLGIPLLTSFVASKAAGIAFTHSLGHEYTYNSSGVRVVALCPSYAFAWQEADHVGKCFIDVFKNADTATAWTIQANEDPVLAPASYTLSQLEALLIFLIFLSLVNCNKPDYIWSNGN